ncbi:MAG: hypothetical protein HOQ28_10240 [Thermoleophilia bacterium]|nr:hypothetical protein [Thermoleophilia bacterium]
MTAADNRPDLAGWWEDGELEPCPECGEQKLAPASSGSAARHVRVCLVCGVVPEPEAGASSTSSL